MEALRGHRIVKLRAVQLICTRGGQTKRHTRLIEGQNEIFPPKSGDEVRVMKCASIENSMDMVVCWVSLKENPQNDTRPSNTLPNSLTGHLSVHLLLRSPGKQRFEIMLHSGAKGDVRSPKSCSLPSDKDHSRSGGCYHQMPSRKKFRTSGTH